VTNIGKTPIILKNETGDNNAIIWVQRILPLEKNIEEASFPGDKNKKYLVNWSIIKSYHPEIQHTKIYPGENDKLFYDFIVPSSLKTIRVYSYFENNCSPGIGWQEDTIYDLSQSARREK
jgi:hypothetical protein